VDNNKYYEVLELTKSATLDEIKKQYKELAKKYHPDRKGGDATKVSLFRFSSDKFQRHMRHWETPKNVEFMISTGPRDLRIKVVFSL
jgi:curved DNA-binding protein CbpA